MSAWMELPPVMHNGTATDFSKSVMYILSIIADERTSKEAGRPVSSSIMPPDPWLVALTYLMWEGIVQGMAWDVAKVGTQKALSYLQSRGIAPKDKKERKSETDVHFSWSGYIEWQPLENLFLKMQFHYDKQKRTRDNERSNEGET